MTVFIKVLLRKLLRRIKTTYSSMRGTSFYISEKLRRASEVVANRYDEKGITGVPVSQGSGAPLPGEFVIAPGQYVIEDALYDFSIPGLYKIYVLPHVSLQRIVPHENLLSVLHALGWSHTYGYRDNWLSEKELVDAVVERPVSLGCAPLSSFVKARIIECGFEARIVACRSFPPWDGYDDGHTLLEIRERSSSQWMAYDPSTNTIFRRGAKYLSLMDLTVGKGAFELVRFRGLGYGGLYYSGNSNLSLWAEQRYVSNEYLILWYKKHFKLPLMLDAGRFVFPQELASEESLSALTRIYTFLPINEFVLRFYTE